MTLTLDQITRFRDDAARRPREVRDGFLGYLVWVGVGELEMILASHEELRDQVALLARQNAKLLKELRLGEPA